MFGLRKTQPLKVLISDLSDGYAVVKVSDTLAGFVAEYGWTGYVLLPGGLIQRSDRTWLPHTGDKVKDHYHALKR